MLLHRSGPYALYGNAFANGECVFTMTDMLAFHTILGSGGLTELKEGHIGLLAVPLQTLPRRGATEAAPLHALEQAKFLVKRFKVVALSQDRRSGGGPKALRFLTGAGAGSKVELGELADATWHVQPYDPACVPPSR